MAVQKSVSYYTTGTVIMPVSFPEDKVRCSLCFFCKHEEAFKRYSCRVTGELLMYPFQGIGKNCPIIFHKTRTQGGRKDEFEGE